MLSISAPAKLNLFLHITGQRQDGYHTLQTLFQLLDFGDQLEFELRSDNKINLDQGTLDCSIENNLVYLAAKLLQTITQTPLGADIALHKRLPAGGGVGGGSSDAASTLLALNKLWRTGLNLQQLADIGLQLGADIPVFIHGRSAWAEGVGEQLSPVSLPTSWYLVIDPQISVSTAAIFSHKNLTRNSQAITLAAFLEGSSRNDCEPVVRKAYPEVDIALKWLSEFAIARLTGTGACLFARFDTQAEADIIKAKVPARWQAFVAQGVDVSITHQQLSSHR
ncbi:MAG: 4-(cytidine 5'-diphospho)-2-C-methyl-D-erythritol kinase [Pseudomonadales bacterium]